MAEWWGVVKRWPIGISFIQSSFALYSLHFELFRISLSVSLDSLLYYQFLRQSSITVLVRRSTHLLFMISWCTFHCPERFAQNTTSRAWGKWLTSHKLHRWGGSVLAPWTWPSRDSAQAPYMKSTQNCVILYKALSLKLSFFVFFRCRIFIRPTHCFYENG